MQVLASSGSQKRCFSLRQRPEASQPIEDPPLAAALRAEVKATGDRLSHRQAQRPPCDSQNRQHQPLRAQLAKRCAAASGGRPGNWISAGVKPTTV